MNLLPPKKPTIEAVSRLHAYLKQSTNHYGAPSDTISISRLLHLMYGCGYNGPSIGIVSGVSKDYVCMMRRGRAKPTYQIFLRILHLAYFVTGHYLSKEQRDAI